VESGPRQKGNGGATTTKSVPIEKLTPATPASCLPESIRHKEHAEKGITPIRFHSGGRRESQESLLIRATSHRAFQSGRTPDAFEEDVLH
jgi:hypothetical protein